MPIIKSAVKKLRQAEKRTVHNRKIKAGVKKLLDSYKKKPTAATLAKLSSALDKAGKTKIIHPNKAARLKSRLSHLLMQTKGRKHAPSPKTATPTKSSQ